MSARRVRKGDWEREIADAIRPALNIYENGAMRVSHGQEDIAETVVHLVVTAMVNAGFNISRGLKS